MPEWLLAGWRRGTDEEWNEVVNAGLEDNTETITRGHVTIGFFCVGESDARISY